MTKARRNFSSKAAKSIPVLILIRRISDVVANIWVFMEVSSRKVRRQSVFYSLSISKFVFTGEIVQEVLEFNTAPDLSITCVLTINSYISKANGTVKMAVA